MLLCAFPLSKKRGQGRNWLAPGSEFSYHSPTPPQEQSGRNKKGRAAESVDQDV